MLDVNLTSQFLCAKAVVPHMLRQGKGKIVNIASIASYIGRPNRVAYCASKGGVLQFTRALATDMKGKNIFVNAITPGSIVTGMNADPASDPNMDWGSETLVERWGQPEDIAHAALFLASDDSDYITGADLRVDGGWLAGRARAGER
jgi:NAD(P)-dependent dehydrogenase (short-subunit alcohol dehydrogenase family)